MTTLLRASRRPSSLQHPKAGDREVLARPQLARSHLGNQALQRQLLAGSLQAKLTVNQPGDPYEQEADRVADEVVRMPGPGTMESSAGSPSPCGLQRKCAQCEAGAGTCPECAKREEPVHRKAQSAGPASLAAMSPVPRGGGKPLPAPVRRFFEPRFGQDFAGVRVHTGAAADASARSIQALAYTHGSDVVFRSGLYAPDSASGRRLLAHELTHVVQQQRMPGPAIHRLSDPDCGTTTALPMRGSCSGYRNTCNSETFVPGSSSPLQINVSVDYSAGGPIVGPEDFSVQVYKCGVLRDTQIGSKRMGPNLPGCLEFAIASVTPNDKYYLKIYCRSHHTLEATYHAWQGTRPTSVPTCKSGP